MTREVVLIGLGLLGVAVLGVVVAGWVDGCLEAWMRRRLTGVVLVPWLRRSGLLVRMGRR